LAIFSVMMKTEIVRQYQLEAGYTLNKVIPIAENNYIVITNKWPDVIRIQAFGDTEFTIYPSDIKELEKGYQNKTFFKHGRGFGLIENTETLVLWPKITEPPEIIKIENPFPADSFGRKFHTNCAAFDETENAIYFGIEDQDRHGYPGRYWAKLEFSKKNMWIFSSSKISAKWDALKELDLSNYPITEFRKYGHEWLSLRSIQRKNSKTYIYTNGGSVTRLKSGPDYEFSLISEFDSQQAFVKNYEVEEGEGFFTTCNRYYVCHSRKNKKRLIFYNLNDFAIDFQVSLTPKQNLGDANTGFVIADMCQDNLYIYNARFLNSCRVIGNV